MRAEMTTVGTDVRPASECGIFLHLVFKSKNSSPEKVVKPNEGLSLPAEDAGEKQSRAEE